MALTLLGGLLTIMTIQTLYHETSAQIEWKMDPKDVIALQGDTVMLNCIVAGRNVSRSEQKFWWYKSDRGQYISRNWALYLQEPDVKRFTVLLDKHLGVYSLVIRNVSRSDAGQYQCIFRENEEQESFSGITTLTVLVPPEHGYPKCKTYPRSRLALSPLETKALHCPSELTDSATNAAQRNRTVYHVWTHKKELVHAFFLQNKTVLLSQAKPKGTPESKAPVAYCLIDDHTLLGHYPKRCQLLEKPQKASARVSPGQVRAPLGENVNYTCHSEDIAVVMDYSWQFSKPIPSVGLSIHENGQVLSIQKVLKMANSLEITCKVRTEWGLTATATADLSVISVNDFVDNSTTDENAIGRIGNATSTSTEATKIAKIIPSKESSIMKNIGFLIGPGIGILLLFIGAVFLACCIIKWKTKSKNVRKGTFSSSSGPHSAVALRTLTRQNRNSSTMSRRFSDSYRFDGNHGPTGNYENFQAISAQQNTGFFRGVSSFQGQNGGPNSPLEANVKVHIEMPNLSASLPALNMYKVCTNGNNENDPPPPPPLTDKPADNELPRAHNFPPPLPLLDTPPNSTLNKQNSYQDLYVEPQQDSPPAPHHHRHEHQDSGSYNYRSDQHDPNCYHHRQDSFSTPQFHDHHHHNGYAINGYRPQDEGASQSYHHDHNDLPNGHMQNGVNGHRKIPPPVIPRRKTGSSSNEWTNGPVPSNNFQPMHRI